MNGEYKQGDMYIIKACGEAMVVLEEVCVMGRPVLSTVVWRWELGADNE